MIVKTWGRLYFLTCENFGLKFLTPCTKTLTVALDPNKQVNCWFLSQSEPVYQQKGFAFSITAKHFSTSFLFYCSNCLTSLIFYPTVQSVNLSGLHWVPWSWRSGYMCVSQACVGKAGPCFPKALTIQQSGFSGQRLLRDSQHCSQSDGVQSRPERQTPRMKCIRGEMIELLYFLSSLFLQDVLDFCRYVYMSRPRWSSLDLNMSIKHEHRKQNK